MTNVLKTTKVHQMAFDDGEDSDGSIHSFTTSISRDSEPVSKWVDHELRKIKRNLSNDVISKCSIRPGTYMHTLTFVGNELIQSGHILKIKVKYQNRTCRKWCKSYFESKHGAHKCQASNTC